MAADGRRVVRHRDAADAALVLPLGNHGLRILGLVHLDAGLAIKKPPKKTHLNKPIKNVFFLDFWVFNFFIFIENNSNFSFSNRFFMNK
jgi:hypothetical protein